MNFRSNCHAIAAVAAFTLAAASFSVFAQDAAQGKGTVKKVDAAAGIVNLAHEPIPALQWPAMTMDFNVKNKAQLAPLKPGQKVSFGLVKDATGGYAISRIAAEKP